MKKVILLISMLAVLCGVTVFSRPHTVFAAEACVDGTIYVPGPVDNTGHTGTTFEDFCKNKGGTAANPSGQCSPKGSFLGFPTWFKYLKGEFVPDPDSGEVNCSVILDGVSDVWKIVAAVIELLLRIASLIAIGFIVVGGANYIVSQGQPDKTKQALRTVINALVGLVIAIVATGLVSFIAGKF